MENSSNPIFNHAAELCVTDPDAWDRVCGPSAALVFRVWRRARGGWWDAPRTPATATDPLLAPDDGVDSAGGRGATSNTFAAGSRFGDKLMGCAVVGLAVLRGAVTTRGGPRLRKIDGWYHVLDDLQRPHGQIKVCGRARQKKNGEEVCRPVVMQSCRRRLSSSVRIAVVVSVSRDRSPRNFVPATKAVLPLKIIGGTILIFRGMFNQT